MINLENENLKNDKKINESKNYSETLEKDKSKILIDSKLKINEDKNREDKSNLKTNQEQPIKLNYQRNKFFDYITKGSSDIEDINYYFKGKNNKKYNNIYSIQESFNLRHISKLEFLMRINLLSNRSFKDINQYPVFPWILKDYNNTNIIDEEKKSIMEENKEKKFEFLEVNKIFYLNNKSENENSLENNSENQKENNLETKIENTEISKENKETSKEDSETLKENNKETSKEKPLIKISKTPKKYVIIRPMDLPMGKIGEARFQSYKLIYNISCEEYKTLTNKEIPLDFTDSSQFQNDEMQLIPILYGTHYSNPAYVCHYLTRIFPYSLCAQLIQGEGFDAPDRLFINLSKSYFSAENIRCDLRELIPEMYYLPELFRNINHINFGNLQISEKEDSTFQILKKKFNINDDNIRVEDVVLPDWCMNNPEKFICINRELFEKKEINIDNWIDLIFGFDQNREGAYEKNNIFAPYCYIGFINLEKIENLNERQLNMKYFDLGINPIQLFNSHLKTEKIYKEKIQFDNNNINSNYKEVIKKCKNDIYKKINQIQNRIEELKNTQKKNIQIQKKLEANINKVIDVKPKIIENEIILHRTKNFSKIISENQHSFDCIYCKYNKAKIYTFYNFKSGEIFLYFNLPENVPNEIRYKSNKKLFLFSNLDNSEITSISIDFYYIFYGTKLGSIIITKNPFLGIEKIIHYHTKKITSICHNNILHLMISSSEDGYINIHTIPNCTLVNSIYDNNFIPDKILISYTPLPSFIIYKNNGNLFRVYSINGRKLLNEDKVIDDVKEIYIGKNSSFIEFLKVNDKDIVYKLPYLVETKYHYISDEEEGKEKNEKEKKKENKNDKEQYMNEIKEKELKKEKNDK